MAQVHVTTSHEPHIDKLLRIFKRCVDKEGKPAAVRKNAYHTKPTKERKCKRAAAKKRWQKVLAKENERMGGMRTSRLYKKRIKTSLLSKSADAPEIETKD